MDLGKRPSGLGRDTEGRMEETEREHSGREEEVGERRKDKASYQRWNRVSSTDPIPDPTRD